MNDHTLQVKLAYLVARTNMVKQLGPMSRLAHVDELMALQLDMFGALVERIVQLEEKENG